MRQLSTQSLVRCTKQLRIHSLGAAKISLTLADRRSEDIGVFSIVVAELKFCDVERQVLFAHFVECAHYAAFDQRPEAFDGLSMDRANDVLAFGMIDHAVRKFLAQMLVADPLIGAEQADLVRDGFAHERFERASAYVLDDAGNDIALATDCTDDRRFPGADSAGSFAAAALVFVPVLREATDERFINLDNATQLTDVLHQGGSDFVAHFPSGFVGTESQVAHDLHGADPLFAGHHEMHNFEPVPQWLIRILKYRADRMAKAVASLWRALVALPRPRSVGEFMGLLGSTAGTANPFRPATRNQISAAGAFVWEHGVEFCGCKLMDGLWLLAVCHLCPPLQIVGGL
jgi:hypothetical protein